MTTLTTLEVGTRMYNGGDMANMPHFGTITNVKVDKWGTHYQITPDPDTDPDESVFKPYWIEVAYISREYLGHGGTRIVTKAAYDAWKQAQLAQIDAAVKAAQYAVKCDECKRTITMTSDIRESYAGGTCSDCTPGPSSPMANGLRRNRTVRGM